MLDDIDRALVAALARDGRMPFTAIAELLGVSSQTVARRYRRLQDEVGLRVVGQVRPSLAGREQWLLRVGAEPRVLQRVGVALSRRADSSHISITSGGSEIVCLVDTDATATDHPLFLRDLPATAGVTRVDAHRLLHVYLGGPSPWSGQLDGLARDPHGRARAEVPDGAPPTLDDADRRLVAALGRDGRAGLAELATRTGRSVGVVARRLRDLRDGGVLYFDVDIDPGALGAALRTLLWMAVAPGSLDAVARTLATRDELAFVAVTTGPTNLVANALTSTPEALHRFLTEVVGRLPGITSLASGPVVRHLKGVGGRAPDPRVV